MKFKEAPAPCYFNQKIVIRFMAEWTTTASACGLASVLCWTRREGGISVSNHSLLCHDVMVGIILRGSQLFDLVSTLGHDSAEPRLGLTRACSAMSLAFTLAVYTRFGRT